MYEEPSDVHDKFSSIKSIAQLEDTDEKHVDFPIKVIPNDGVVGEKAPSPFVNPKGPLGSAAFRHVSELEATIHDLNLDEDKDLPEAKKVKTEL
jgi:hypothetical protein